MDYKMKPPTPFSKEDAETELWTDKIIHLSFTLCAIAPVIVMAGMMAHIKDQSYRLWLEKFLHWEVDPDFRVTEEDAKLVDPEGRFPIIMNARSLKELKAYTNIIRDLYRQREIKENAGFWKNLGSSFLDPTVLFPCVLGIE